MAWMRVCSLASRLATPATSRFTMTKSRAAVTATKTHPLRMLRRVMVAGCRARASTARSDSRIQSPENPA